ncbi:MAG TPA: formimidoylglutamase [Flavobacterium sp.]|nr:formimidoylglutamase [Flavobacterium sp.]
MENLIRLTPDQLSEITSYRKGEIKFGERIQTIPENTTVVDYLAATQAQFVLFGIPEDIGIRANFGRSGTITAFHNALGAIANIQHNRFCKGSNLLILGQIATESYLERAKNLNPAIKEDLKQLYKIVTEIDKEVTHLVSLIVKSGKIPIAIGGGHNNAYGMIKGTALGKAKPINAINFDAHTDFRALEGRHSGNGFSYAYEEGFLNKYFIFGLHENYTSKGVFLRIKETVGRVFYNTYEQMSIRKETSFTEQLDKALAFIQEEDFGIEIDLDAVEAMPSSAMTLSGFSSEKVRKFIHYFGSSPQAAYLHICEGAPGLSDDKNPNLIGKFIAYLVTDFMKARVNKEV